MNRCLDEAQVLQAALGESAPGERAHTECCLVCRRRIAEWNHDLGRIREACVAAPPPRAPQSRPMLVPAIAAAILLAVALATWLRPASVPVRVADDRSSLARSRYALEVSEAVFDPRPTPRVSAAESALERALGSGSPCTGRRLVGAACNDYTSALYF